MREPVGSISALVGHFSSVSSADFSADGRWVVTTGPLAAVLWRASTGHRLDYVRGHADHVTAASFAPRGYGIATVARDGTVRSYDCKLCRPLEGLIALARRRLAETAG